MDQDDAQRYRRIPAPGEDKPYWQDVWWDGGDVEWRKMSKPSCDRLEEAYQRGSAEASLGSKRWTKLDTEDPREESGMLIRRVTSAGV